MAIIGKHALPPGDYVYEVKDHAVTWPPRVRVGCVRAHTLPIRETFLLHAGRPGKKRDAGHRHISSSGAASCFIGRCGTWRGAKRFGVTRHGVRGKHERGNGIFYNYSFLFFTRGANGARANKAAPTSCSSTGATALLPRAYVYTAYLTPLAKIRERLVRDQDVEAVEHERVERRGSPHVHVRDAVFRGLDTYGGVRQV